MVFIEVGIMNLEHLSDNELIDYIIKHDDDPIRLRLATHMQRLSGAIMDDLIDAGMDATWCTFENTYHPGQYIKHLEDELRYLQEQLDKALSEIEELRPMKVSDLIIELKQKITTEQWRVRHAEQGKHEAEKSRDEMKHKLDMWTILKR